MYMQHLSSLLVQNIHVWAGICHAPKQRVMVDYKRHTCRINKRM
jgi:hypothetical protein